MVLSGAGRTGSPNTATKDEERVNLSARSGVLNVKGERGQALTPSTKEWDRSAAQSVLSVCSALNACTPTWPGYGSRGAGPREGPCGSRMGAEVNGCC